MKHLVRLLLQLSWQQGWPTLGRDSFTPAFFFSCSDQPCHSCQSCQLGFAEERSSPTSAGRSCQPGLGLERSSQPGLQLPAQCQASMDCHQSPEPDEPLPIHDDCCPQLDIAKTTTDKDSVRTMLKQFALGPIKWLRLCEMNSFEKWVCLCVPHLTQGHHATL